MKKNIIILGFIVCLGFVLRSYHLDFPSLGYHNMKENEYLSIAEEMLRTKDFISRRIYFYNAFEEEPLMKIYPQPPLVSYQALISWKLLGNNLWGPRLFNVLFGLASIVVIYLIALLLFQEIKWALSCAFLLAIMPQGVFFSRNLQPESPAFFFMLLGNYYYLRFILSGKKINLFLCGLSFSAAWFYKFSFLFGIVPFIYCFPFLKIYKERQGLLKYALVVFAPYLVILAAIVWLKHIGQWEFQELNRIRLLEFFSFLYWKRYGRMLFWYIGENYTWIFAILSLLGITVALLRREGLLNRYLLGWLFTVLPYGMVFSDYLNQHSYYQMPFLAMVCIACAYAVLFMENALKEFIKKGFFVFLVIFIIVVSIPFIHSALKGMYGKVFLGEDVAGESLGEFTLSDERIFLLTHCQGYAISRYAQRYTGWPGTLEDFKEKEAEFKVRYICIYPAEFLETIKADSTFLEYIQNNYRIKELGLLKIGEANYKIIYFIYEKGIGGMGDVNKFMDAHIDKVKLRRVYRVPGKSIPFYTVRGI